MFDSEGRLLGRNSEFFTVRNASGSKFYPSGVPELFDTCFDGNGVTPWLTTSFQ